MKYLFQIFFFCVYQNFQAQINSADGTKVTHNEPEIKNENSLKALKALTTVISSTTKPNNNIDTSVINQLNRSAAECLNKGELTNAKGFFSLSLKQAAKQHYWQGLADALYLKGEFQIFSGQIDSSIYTLHNASIYYKLIKDTLQQKRINEEIVSAYYIKGDVASAHFLRKINGDKLEYLETDNVLFFGLYIGALIFCLIYNLFLYRFTKDICYKELAKCIFSFTVFIYTTNNDFAAQFSRNLTHFTILELLKVNSIFFSTYFFATFVENLLISRKGVLTRFYRFLSVYKKSIRFWIIISDIIVIYLISANKDNAYDYSKAFLQWWLWNDLAGLIASLILFTFLFAFTYKKKIKLNYLIYGFVFNILLLSISFAQATVQNKFSHIPYPHALGSVIFLIFMTVAITDKINQYRKETESARENALKHLEMVVAERTSDLKQQKEVVEEKNKEITDSITYAKRLQQAILPPLHFIQQHFTESFVVYKPKDIVAGDFYWCEALSIAGHEYILIAVADCTGHGVPGAMVSVVCSNALNRTVKEFSITEPGKVLDKTREMVLETFARSESEVKDGMDISLLCIDKTNQKVFWSGANNPLWYISNGELKEIKADKQPIGKTEYPKTFSTHSIEYNKNNIFYLFSDGLSDQFGGAKGKKFKHKQLKDILVSTATLPLNEQAELIGEKFDNWKGKLEQVDDVCIIGIKL